MKRVASISASIAAFTLAALASGASAQTWAPAPTDGWSLSGRLQVQQSLSLSCGVSGHATTSSSNAGVIDAFAFVAPDSLCGLLGENTPWAIEPLSSGPSGTGPGVRIYLDVTALFNTCTGYVDGDYDNVNTISFPAGSVVQGSSPACTVEGEVVLTPDHGNTAPLIITP